MSQEPRIVIVGGGTAGITVAARLRKKLSGAAITVVDPAGKHFYQPLWTLIGAGMMPKEDSERNEADVIPDGVQWKQDAIVEFLPEENAVKTKGGERLDYDYLVVCPGIQIDWDKIKGLKDALGKDGVTSNYSYDCVEKTWEFLNNFQGGNAIFTMPVGPIKCAGAPQKIMWLADDAFRKAGIRDKVNVVCAFAGMGIFGVEHYAKTLRGMVEERNIETHFQHNLTEIRAASKEAVFENLATGESVTMNYELIHVVPPMSAPDFIKESPLSDEEGWVSVDKFTTQHTKYENIFSLGDASSLPTSRTGAAVRKQAPVTVDNLVAHHQGKPLEAKYDGYASCPLVTRYNRVILAEFGYDGKIMETFPFDQSKERYSMYLLKRYALPKIYWDGMLKGRM